MLQNRVPAIGAEHSEEAAAPTLGRQIVLTIEGMTCAACPKTVRTALTKVDGVHEVTVTYEPPQAVVRFDSQTTSVEALMQATKQAGYSSHPSSS